MRSFSFRGKWLKIV